LGLLLGILHPGVTVAQPPLSIWGTVETVTNSESHPAANIRVELLAKPNDYRWGRGVLEGSSGVDAVATSSVDALGRFELKAPGPGVWMVRVQAPGFVPMSYSPVVIPPSLPSLTLPPVVLYPEEGARVEVRTPQGEPAPGVWVLGSGADPDYWRPRVGDGWRLDLRLARSDEAGVVTLPRGLDEALELQIFTAGSTQSVTATAGAVGRVTVASPEPATTRWIEIRDALQQPLAGVLVSGAESGWPLGLTGQDGRLALTGNPARVVTLKLLAADGRTATLELPKRHDENPVTPSVLAPVAPLTGKVLDSNRRPLAGALVWVGPDSGTFSITDSRGTYTLPVGERDHLWVQIHAVGFLPRRVSLRPGGPGARRAPTVALEAAATVRGRVVDETGTPLANVALAAEATSREGRPAAYHPDNAVGRGRSDAQGRFVIPNLRAGATYALAATLPGFTPARLPFAGQRDLGDIELVLRPARGAFGRVIDIRDQPIPGVEVTVRRSGGPESVNATTDAAGRFHVAALPATTVDIQARGQGFAPLTVPGVEVAPGTDPVELGTLVLSVGARIEGLVQNAAGMPLAEVGVWVLENLDRPLLRETDRLRLEAPTTRSGQDGRFRLEGLPPGRMVHLLFHGEGYLPLWIQGVKASADRPTAQDPLTAVMEPAFHLRGRVIDEAGEVVSRARVNVYPQAPPTGAVGVTTRRKENAQQTVSDALGEFSFEELAPGKVQLVARAEGFLEMDPVSATVSPQEVAGSVELVLRRGAVVKGHVVNTAGAPVAEARLRVGPVQGSSDAEGAFRLVGVPLGVKALLLHHPEYRRLVQEIFVEPGVNTLDVVLEEGWSLSGQAVNEDGDGVAGAHIEVRSVSLRVPTSHTTTTDAEGAFRLVVSAPGRYTLSATSQGFAPTHAVALEVADDPVAGIEVVLRRGATVTGRVLGLALEALADVRIEAERPEGEENAAPRSVGLDYRGEYTLHHLEPGDWHLRAVLDGGRRQAEAQVTVHPGTREVEQDLEFGRGVTLTGEARYQGQPVNAASVSLIDSTDTARRSVRTDHQGTFRIEDVEPGRYRLDLLDPQRALSHGEGLDLTADRHVVLELESVPLRGVVVSATDGAPLADVLVLVRKVGGSLTTLGSDAEGRFTVAHITPGSYRIEARKDGYAPTERPLAVVAGTTPEPVELALEPAGGLTLRLKLVSGEIPGVTTLSLFDTEGRKILTDTRAPTDAGYVHFPLAPKGTWRLLVSTPGAAPTELTATIPGPLVELTLPSAAPLTVRVPALVEYPSAALLTLLASDGQPIRRVDPGGDIRRQWPFIGGRATVDDLPAGHWTVRIEAEDGRQWDRRAITDGALPVVVTVE
jgi:protocatechuate 3,4-dioxygenase beta subunit